MKALKITLISILSIFITIYITFLFVLPYAVDLNKYSPQITKALQDNSGLAAKLEGLKIRTSWNLSAGASIEKMDLSYPDGKKFAQINNLQVRLSLLPVIFGKIKLDKIEADKVLVNLDMEPNGKFLLEKYLPKQPSNTSSAGGMNLSDDMPDVKIEQYRVSFLSGKNDYTVKGNDLKISDFVLNKKIKFSSNGEIILNKRKQISYDLALFSKIFPQAQAPAQKKEEVSILEVFENLYKYNFQTDVKADLKLTGSVEEPDIQGQIDLNKIALSIGGKTLPKSRINLVFKGDKIKINSDIHSDFDSSASVTGTFKNGKNRKIDIHVKSKQICIEDSLYIANSVLKSFGKNDLEGTSANGYISADFDLKSDFKKIESAGFLRVKNANIANKIHKISINSINADVDFSQNSIKIKKAGAKILNHPISVSGSIDKHANADILVTADKLQLKGLLLATGNAGLLKDNDMSALVTLKAVLKGRLDKANPKVNVLVENLYIKNKPMNLTVKLPLAQIEMVAGSKNQGTIKLAPVKIVQPPSLFVSINSTMLKFDDNELLIPRTSLMINGIPTNLEGKIVNLQSKPKIEAIRVEMPNQASFALDGFPGSRAIVKGGITISGNPENPVIRGGFSLPSVSIPTISTTLRNAEVTLDKEYKIDCPSIHTGNTLMSFSADINKDFSKGIVLQNANFSSNSIDLDSIAKAMSSMPASPQGGDLGITITNGRASVGKFKTGNIVASNITSGLRLKNNILYMENLYAQAYNGEIKGQISYNVLSGKTGIDVSGRGLSANPALTALSGRNDRIIGVLDFDADISFKGATDREIMNSLNGDTNFIISNGEMGLLGKFEYLLNAQNILSNSVFKATLNVIANAISAKDTGVYKYMKGKINLSNGWANIRWIKTSGPNMSLYMTGRYRMTDNIVSMTILGRISDDVVRILGPIGEFSMDKVLYSIPRIGEITAALVSQYTVNPSYENTDLIPELTPKTNFSTKEFKVVIDGNVQKQNAVKTFKWISKPTVAKTVVNIPDKNQIQSTVKQYQSNIKEQYQDAVKQIPRTVPDFINKLPNLVN